MSKKRVLFACACIGALATLVLWLRSRVDRAQAHLELTRSVADVNAEAVSLATVITPDQLDQRTLSGGSSAHASVDAIATSAKWPRTLSGTIVLHTRGGDTKVALRGGLVFDEVREGQSESHTRRARIVDDRWELKVEGPSALTPKTAQVNTVDSPRTSVRASAESISFSSELPTTEPLLLWMDEGPRLHVLDRETHEHLNELTLCWLEPKESPYAEISATPSPDVPVDATLGRSASPIELPPWVGTRIGWVRSPNSAWHRFAVSSTDTTVYLQPGGVLDVQVVGRGDSSPLMLRVYGSTSFAESRAVLAERRIETETRVQFTGLARGDVTIQLERMGRSRPSGFMTSARTTVVPGHTTSAVVDASRSAALMGSLEVRLLRPTSGPTLAAKGLCVVLEARSRPRHCDDFWLTPESTTITDRALSWSSPSIEPGEYTLTVIPWGLAAEVAVKPGAVEQVELQVEEPIEVELHFQRARDGSISHGADILVRPMLAKSPSAWREIQADRVSRSYRLKIQPGALQVYYPGHPGSQVETCIVTRESRVFTIELPESNSSRVLVEATLDGNPLLLPAAFWESMAFEGLDKIDGRVRTVALLGHHVGDSVSVDTSLAEFELSAGGRFLCSPGRWPGFEALEPQLVMAGTSPSTVQFRFVAAQ